jgi:hypothetical protein
MTFSSSSSTTSWGVAVYQGQIGGLWSSAAWGKEVSGLNETVLLLRLNAPL